jgi:hypothetical protein
MHEEVGRSPEAQVTGRQSNSNSVRTVLVKVTHEREAYIFPSKISLIILITEVALHNVKTGFKHDA